jgi:hypothetical protein
MVGYGKNSTERGVEKIVAYSVRLPTIQEKGPMLLQQLSNKDMKLEQFKGVCNKEDDQFHKFTAKGQQGKK